MKQIFIVITLIATVITIRAQETESIFFPTKGEYYDNEKRPFISDRMISPYSLEVTFSKTVHVIFPAAIRYVDLGSTDLLAAKADGAENVLRVKAASRNFLNESNLTIITEDGGYYSFNVRYADIPARLSIEMINVSRHEKSVDDPDSPQEVYMTELGRESPSLVKSIMQTIYNKNESEFKHIGSKRFGIRYLLKGIYSHDSLLYFHLQLENFSNITFEIDYICFKIVDKKIAKRTAIQEQIISPLRTHNNASLISGRQSK